jgi:hypothetical protein
VRPPPANPKTAIGAIARFLLQFLALSAPLREKLRASEGSRDSMDAVKSQSTSPIPNRRWYHYSLRSLIAILCLLSFPRAALATQQIGDWIKYQGAKGVIDEHPLENLWEADWSRRPDFRKLSTANRKGYAAAWEIRGSRLYLVSFTADRPQPPQSPLAAFLSRHLPFAPKRKSSPMQIGEIVPGKRLPVHANWYSGTLHIIYGDPILTAGGSRYERISVVEIEKGIVIRASEKHDAGKEGP